MKSIVVVMALIVGFSYGVTVQAQNSTQNLGKCLVDTLNGKERKNLAKWIYFAIAAHPEMKSFSNITPEDVDTSDRYVGQLITRMLTEDCPNELKIAHKENPLAIQTAFKLVGEVAMQELMANPETRKSITKYGQYADQAKINKILTE